MAAKNTFQKEHAAMEAEVIRKARQGDQTAYDRVIAEYEVLVQKIARSYFLIGGDNDDIVQEGMIGLYKAVRDYSDNKQSSFRTFAEMCITRQILTAIEAANRKKHQPLNSYVSLNKPVYENESNQHTLMESIELTADHGDPEQMLIEKEAVDNTTDLIKKTLSTFEYQVLSFYLDGTSYQDISYKLGKPQKSIDNALQRIKRKLMAELKDEGDGKA